MSESPASRSGKGKNKRVSGPPETPAHTAPSDVPKDQPEWAEGLKRLYDAVLDEPMPESFKDLLAKLDDEGDS